MYKKLIAVLLAIVCLYSQSYAATVTVLATADADVGFATSDPHYNLGRPNPSCAASVSFVVCATEQNFTVFDKSLNQISQELLVTFATHQGGYTVSTFIEPQVLYDANESRIYMTFNGNNDLLFVSLTGDPTDTAGNWDCISPSAAAACSAITPGSCPGAVGSCNFGDIFLRLGFTANVIETTQFCISPYSGCTSGAVAIGLPKADIRWTAGNHIVTTHLATNTDKTIPLNSMPIINQDASTSAPMWLITRNGVQTQTNWSITPILKAYTLSGTTISTTAATTLTPSPSVIYNMRGGNMFVVQPGVGGAQIRTPENFRFFQAFQKGNYLWAAAHSANQVVTDQTLMTVYWFKFDASTTTPTIADQGWIDETGSSIWNMMPAMAIDSNGTVVMLTSRGDATSIYPSIAARYHLNTDAAGVFSSPSSVYAGGSQPFVCNSGGCLRNGNGLWGTYCSLVMDPDGVTFWGVHEYADNDNTNGKWKARVVKFQITLPATGGGSVVQGAAKFSGGVVRH